MSSARQLVALGDECRGEAREGERDAPDARVVCKGEEQGAALVVSSQWVRPTQRERRYSQDARSANSTTQMR